MAAGGNGGFKCAAISLKSHDVVVGITWGSSSGECTFIGASYLGTCTICIELFAAATPNTHLAMLSQQQHSTDEIPCRKPRWSDRNNAGFTNAWM